MGYAGRMPDTANPLPSDIDTVVLDIDGTLVDSNYHHTLAWSRAFHQHGHEVPLWRIHRANGMGGDRLVAEVAGDDVEDSDGDAIREAWEKGYDALIEEVRPLPDADRLLAELDRRQVKLVLATSGKPKHTEYALKILGASDRVDEVTSASDAPSKPAPDLIDRAVDAVDGSRALVIGDSVWDAEAAQRRGAPMVGLLTGGFGRDELLGAGAAVVYADLAELVDHLDELLSGS
jgi:phosphoglycolate phosphatase-like HAD superfamily hydrolase